MHCEKDVVVPYKSCDSLHGKMVNVAKDTMRLIQDPSIKMSKMSFGDWTWYMEGKSPTVEECEYYSQLI